MTATLTYIALDDAWLAQTPNPTWEDVNDDVLFEQIHLHQSRVDLVFEKRTDDLRYLADGEITPPGGFDAWDGSDCYMGFITAHATARIAAILSSMSPEQLIKDATWLEEDTIEGHASNLKEWYPDLLFFIEEAARNKRGLVVFYTG